MSYQRSMVTRVVQSLPLKTAEASFGIRAILKKLIYHAFSYSHVYVLLTVQENIAMFQLLCPAPRGSSLFLKFIYCM